jgi:beta-glucanase (GH16 family)
MRKHRVDIATSLITVRRGPVGLALSFQWGCMRLLAAAGIVLLLLPGWAFAQDWRLVWSDEFDAGTLPDPARWNFQVGGGGWGNQELQYYTDARPENARIENGLLVIEARAESYGGASFTSARLTTRGKGDWLYGRMEMRAKLPAGLGTWPAFWMLASDSDYGTGGWPDTGEIDIMEGVGHEPDRSHSAVHTLALNHRLGNNPSSTTINPDSRSAFHVYAVEWTPTRITTYVDDDIGLVYDRGTSDWRRWPFDKPFHLILNLAVGGSWGGVQGVNPADFPARFEVDYVRVYEDAAGPPLVQLGTADGRTDLAEGEAISLRVEASDPVSSISSLALYQDEGLLASTTAGSGLEVPLNGALPGCYRLKARAIDSEGWEGFSDTLLLHIGPECVQAPYLIVPPTIPGRIQAEYYDLGGPGVAYQELSPQNTGNGIRASEGVDIGTTADIGGGYQVENMTFREWTEYTVRVAQSGRYRMVARVAATRDGQLRLSVDGAEVSTPLIYRSTNSTTFFRNATLDDIHLEAGVSTLRIMYDAFGAYINWFEFQLVYASDVSTAQPGGEPAVRVYPNPFANRLHIDTQKVHHGVLRARLVDMTGRVVWKFSGVSSEDSMNLIRADLPDNLAGGVYVLVLQSVTTTTTHVVIRQGGTGRLP